MGHVRTLQGTHATVGERHRSVGWSPPVQCESLSPVSLLMCLTCARGERRADGQRVWLNSSMASGLLRRCVGFPICQSNTTFRDGTS